ncbi:MAG: glycosyltransferase [Lachnospiraceae bacterium]|nr:glycosyltransferase [Lachnospiraceae bacterium]
MPKISIIMGVFNGEQQMDQAIESVCCQTFQDWELIICDDASSDGTYQRLLWWSGKDPRIVVLHNNRNLRLARTLNVCLDHAKGEYIARMDDDDVSYPRRLEKQAAFLDNHKEFGFVSSLVDCYDGTQIVKNRFYRVAEPGKKDFLRGTQFVHPATMFRKECLKAVGGYRIARETVRTEDYDLFMRLYARGYRGYNIQEPLLRYFVNPEAMQQKRLYRYRINEAVVRWKGFKAMGLMPGAFPYVVRPLIVGLIPQRLIWNLVYKKKG